MEMEAITMKRITEAELAKELREQYIKNPPEGMTSDEVRDTSDDDLLDMDYFLHEFDDLMMTISAKKVLYLLNSNRLFPLPAFVRAIIQKSDGSRTFL